MGGRALKIAIDTNVLVRAVVRDDPAQAVALVVEQGYEAELLT